MNEYVFVQLLGVHLMGSFPVSIAGGGWITFDADAGHPLRNSIQSVLDLDKFAGW